MSVLPLMLMMGLVFGALAAAGAYVISYSEYRQRFLRPGQNAQKMALQVAAVTFAFFLVASALLGLLLGQVAKSV
jgi:threonine/homoserine/homoserine lactone efflux protein